MRVRPSVLIVDDDQEFLDATAESLRAVCSEVFVARAPLVALWVLEREVVDVILCDCRLGNADGRHLLSQVHDSWPGVARVMVTGFSDQWTSAGAFPAAQAVLLKPLDGDSLADLVTRLGVVRAARGDAADGDERQE